MNTLTPQLKLLYHYLQKTLKNTKNKILVDLDYDDNFADLQE